MTEIPRDHHLDSTRVLAAEGYGYIHKRCRELNTDIFATRIMLQETYCITGEAGARLFYNEDLFQRQGAAPLRMQKTLLGKGSVQSLDDDAHRHRKAMFMSLMTQSSIDWLSELVSRHWRAALRDWESMDQVELLDQVHQIHCRAVCEWAGVPLPEPDVGKRTHQLVSLVESPGRIGPAHWQGRLARAELENWCGQLIEQTRAKRLAPAPDQALQTLAQHRSPDGKLLDSHTAAVELLNVLRPTVAVARYVVFIALAFHDYPRYRNLIADGDDALIPLFVQEVRRYYPFFPFAVARTRQDFEWQGYQFSGGRRALLDLYGINRDPQLWQDPDTFHPERFRDWKENAFSLVPQGGSDHHHQHRCAGEWATLSLMAMATRFLSREIDYRVPTQDLTIKLNWMPANPNSRFLIDQVRRKR